MKPDIHRKYYKIFDTPDGQDVLEDMKLAHHFYSSSFDPRVKELVNFNEGERNAVLRILTILSTKPKEATNAGTKSG